MRLRYSIVMVSILVACILSMGRGWAAPAQDDSILLAADELKKMGVDLSGVVFGLISDDGTLAIAEHKETNAKEIARGKIRWIHIFRIDWKTRKVTQQKVSLNLPALENYAFTPDHKGLIVVGQSGTKVLLVDLTTLAVRPLFAYEKGKPGFRITPPVLWEHKGKVYTFGYFYDETQLQVSQNVVAINPAATGVAIFEKASDIGALNERVKLHASSNWFSPTQAWFTFREKQNEQRIYAYQGDEKNLVYVDRGARVDSIAVGQDRLIYALRELDGTGRLKIYEVGSKKLWNVGDGKSNYTYVYMSKDGSTILASLFDFPKQKMTTWYAHEDDGFKLHPVPGMEESFPGTIRMSPNGKYILVFKGESKDPRAKTQPGGAIFRRIP